MKWVHVANNANRRRTFDHMCEVLNPNEPYQTVNIYIRDLPRFFDQVGHRTTDASIETKHFFTK